MANISYNIDTPTKFSILVNLILGIGIVALWVVTLDSIQDIVIKWIFSIVMLFLLIYTVYTFNKEFKKWEELEIAQKRFLQEQTINEILKQDNLIIDLMLKEIEYNKIPKKAIQTITVRNMKEITKQAMNPTFYEDLFRKRKE